MNAITKFDFSGLEQVARPSQANALPDAPLAMPVQSLYACGPLAWLRAAFGFAGRTVKH